MDSGIEKIGKLLSSGFKSSEFTALVTFVLIVLGNLYFGDSMTMKLITDTHVDPAMTDIISMARNQDAQNVKSLELILYAIMGYFAKRGTLKWKELSVTKPRIAVKKKIVGKQVNEDE